MASMSLGSQTTNGDVSTPNPTLNNAVGTGIGQLAQALSEQFQKQKANAALNNSNGSGAVVGNQAVANATAPAPGTSEDSSVGNVSGDFANLPNNTFDNSQAPDASNPGSGSAPVPSVLGNGQSQVASLDPNTLGSVLSNIPGGGSSTGTNPLAGSSASSDNGVQVASLDPTAGLDQLDKQNASSTDTVKSGIDNTIGDDFLSQYAKSRGLDPALVKQVAQKNGVVPNQVASLDNSAGAASLPTKGTTGLLADTYTKGGLSTNAAAGVIGNQAQESNFNPSIIGDNGTSGGLSQWHGPRFASMQSAAQAQGVDWRDPTFQANYTVYDLKTNYPKVLAAANAAGSPAEAADIISKYYESPAAATANNAHREAVATAVAGGASMPVGGSTSSQSGGAGISNQFAGAGNYQDYNIKGVVGEQDAYRARLQNILNDPNSSYDAKVGATGMLKSVMGDTYTQAGDLRKIGDAAVNDQNTNNISATNALTSQGDLALKQAEYAHPEMDITPIGNNLVGINRRTGEQKVVANLPPTWGQPVKMDDGSLVRQNNLGETQKSVNGNWVPFGTGAPVAGTAYKPIPGGASAPAAPAAPAPSAPVEKTTAPAAAAATVAAGQQPNQSASGAKVGVTAPLMSPPPGAQGVQQPVTQGSTLQSPPDPLAAAGNIDTSALNQPQLAGHVDAKGQLIPNASVAPGSTLGQPPDITANAAPIPVPAPTPAAAEPTPTNPELPAISDAFKATTKALSPAQIDAMNKVLAPSAGNYSDSDMSDIQAKAQNLASGKISLTDLPRGERAGSKAEGLKNEVALQAAIAGGYVSGNDAERQDLIKEYDNTSTGGSLGYQRQAFGSMTEQMDSYEKNLAAYKSFTQSEGKVMSPLWNAAKGTYEKITNPTSYASRVQQLLQDEANTIVDEHTKIITGKSLGEAAAGIHGGGAGGNEAILEGPVVFAANTFLNGTKAIFDKTTGASGGIPYESLKDSDQPYLTQVAQMQQMLHDVGGKLKDSQQLLNNAGVGRDMASPETRQSIDRVSSINTGPNAQTPASMLPPPPPPQRTAIPTEATPIPYLSDVGSGLSKLKDAMVRRSKGDFTGDY